MTKIVNILSKRDEEITQTADTSPEAMQRHYTLHRLEKFLRGEVDNVQELTPLQKSRISANVGVALRRNDIIVTDNTVIAALTQIVEGAYHAGRDSVAIKPLEWKDTILTINTVGDIEAKVAETAFGRYIIYYLHGKLLFRIDGYLREQYDCSPEEATKIIERDIYAPMVRELL